MSDRPRDPHDGPDDASARRPPKVDGRPPTRVDGRPPTVGSSATARPIATLTRPAPAPPAGPTIRRTAAGESRAPDPPVRQRPPTEARDGRAAPGGTTPSDRSETRPAPSAPAPSPGDGDDPAAARGRTPEAAPAPPPPEDTTDSPPAGDGATGGGVGGAATPSLLATLAPGTWPARTPPLTTARTATPPPPTTRILGQAPSPPFEPAEAPYRWKTSLPGAIGRRVTVEIGDHGLSLGGTHIDFDDIESVRMTLEVEAAVIHRRPSARMSVLMSRRDGHAVRASARSALSVDNTNAIVHTLGYLWDVLGDTAGVRQREQLIAKIQRGGEALVGGLRLNRIGVAWKRSSFERWSEIGDPQIEKRQIVIPTSGAPIEVGIGADDAYILPALIPQLRRRFR